MLAGGYVVDGSLSELLLSEPLLTLVVSDTSLHLWSYVYSVRLVIPLCCSTIVAGLPVKV